MSDPEIVYGFDSEGEAHALYPVDINSDILPTAFCGAVLANKQTIAELPDGVVIHSCKPTKAEKAEQKEAVKAEGEQPTP